jgi:DNA-binding transcriptional LysR family regulator
MACGQFGRQPEFCVPMPAPDLVAIDQGQASARAGLGLHHLRYVLAAAEHGGFRRAARRLGVQQSAVSRRIQELEGRLGAAIFERGPHGVRLTLAGEDFVRGAQGAVGELDLAVDRATEAARTDHGTLRVGVLAGLGGGILQDRLRQLLAAEPDLVLDLIEGSGDILAAALGQGRLDLAFLLSPPVGLVSTPAWRERLVVAVPVGDPLAGAASLCWADLAGRRLLIVAPIAGLVHDLAARRLASTAIFGRAAAPASLARLVALGQGLGLVGEGDACRATGVVYRPLARSFLGFDAVLGRRPEKPVVRQLLALLPGVA